MGNLLASIALTLVAASSAVAAPDNAPTRTAFAVLHIFSGGSGGGLPFGALATDSAGTIYGTTLSGGSSTCSCGVVYRFNPMTSEFSAVHKFAGGASDGQDPTGLIRDKAGNLYGTSRQGGTANQGVVFRIGSTGHATLLYAFCRQTGCADGADPLAPPVLDTHGNLFGTTGQGGGGPCTGGCGIVYKLDATGHETVLYTFQGSPGDGSQPGQVILDAESIYGTTSYGGMASEACAGGTGCGTVFEVTQGGAEHVLHAFAPGTGDGTVPFAALARDAAGKFLGTTSQGGATGDGTVFEVAPGGAESVTYSFGGSGGGLAPEAPVLRDRDGNLHGTTEAGGANGLGTVFVLTAAGKERVVHSFSGSDGMHPGNLIAGASGAYYGTTLQGGSGNLGTIFRTP